MTELEKKLIDYANAVIDNMCESEGVDVAIDDLIAFGFTKEELTEGLSFDSDDVNEYLGETDDDYDDEDKELHKFTVKCYNIDYCIEEEDVCDEIANDPSIEEDSEEYYKAIHNKIKEIKDSLPKTFTFTFECTEDELDDLIAEEISDETGWLTNSFKKEIV